MNFLSILIIASAIPSAIFSQSTPKSKALTGHQMNVRHAANYYLHNKNPSPEFSVRYNSLFSGRQQYTTHDTIIATQLIQKLYELNDILFFRLMRRFGCNGNSKNILSHRRWILYLLFSKPMKIPPNTTTCSLFFPAIG
jgi:hypothetical protein